MNLNDCLELFAPFLVDSYTVSIEHTNGTTTTTKGVTQVYHNNSVVCVVHGSTIDYYRIRYLKSWRIVKEEDDGE